MKKAICCILKLLAICAVLAGAVCAVLAYWDRITEFLAGVKSRFMEKKESCCPSTEYDDYAD